MRVMQGYRMASFMAARTAVTIFFNVTMTSLRLVLVRRRSPSILSLGRTALTFSISCGTGRGLCLC